MCNMPDELAAYLERDTFAHALAWERDGADTESEDERDELEESNYGQISRKNDEEEQSAMLTLYEHSEAEFPALPGAGDAASAPTGWVCVDRSDSSNFGGSECDGEDGWQFVDSSTPTVLSSPSWLSVAKRAPAPGAKRPHAPTPCAARAKRAGRPLCGVEAVRKGARGGRVPDLESIEAHEAPINATRRRVNVADASGTQERGKAGGVGAAYQNCGKAGRGVMRAAGICARLSAGKELSRKRARKGRAARAAGVVDLGHGGSAFQRRVRSLKQARRATCKAPRI
eukprot:g6160.t1